MATMERRLDIEIFSSLFATSRFAMVLFMMALSASSLDILHFMFLIASSVSVIDFTGGEGSTYSSSEGNDPIVFLACTWL